MKRFLFISVLLLPLISCSKISTNTNRHIPSYLCDFTRALFTESLYEPVEAMNSVSEARLHSPDFRDTVISATTKFTISLVEPGHWVARHKGTSTFFETDIWLLPETVPVADKTLHIWSASTKGTYSEDNHSSTFGSVDGCFTFYWSVTKYDSRLDVSMSYDGKFRTDIKSDSGHADFGVLVFDGEKFSFSSSLGGDR